MEDKSAIAQLISKYYALISLSELTLLRLYKRKIMVACLVSMKLTKC